MEAPDGQEMKYAQAGWGCAVENTSSQVGRQHFVIGEVSAAHWVCWLTWNTSQYIYYCFEEVILKLDF
jgi:hypothetical protein